MELPPGYVVYTKRICGYYDANVWTPARDASGLRVVVRVEPGAFLSRYKAVKAANRLAWDTYCSAEQARLGQ